jgi:hypothetical protein
MNSRLRLPFLGVLAAAAFLTAQAAATAAETRGLTETQRVMSGAPGPRRLSNADEKRLDTLMVDHRTTRGRLPPDQRRDLDQLTARVRDVLFPTGAEAPGAGAWDNAKKTVAGLMPSLSMNENAALAAYAVDGIVAGDIEVLRFAKTDPSFTMLADFKLQYMQLQQQMRNVSRSYATMSNVLRTKHDTVKNSISNVR